MLLNQLSKLFNCYHFGEYCYHFGELYKIVLKARCYVFCCIIITILGKKRHLNCYYFGELLPFWGNGLIPCCLMV